MGDTDIYQRIYDADMSAAGSGIAALIAGETRDEKQGYIIVNEGVDETEGKRLFSEVHIPEHKAKSYELAQALFDNYEASNTKRESYLEKERTEIEALLTFALTRPAMKIAQEYVKRFLKLEVLTDDKWYDMVYDMWFRFTEKEFSPTHSGFEHVFLGEEYEAISTVGGFHWWYYFVQNAERIAYKGARYSSKAKKDAIVTPEIVTMSFAWQIDSDSLIQKRQGGMLVGVSVEAFLAMGMVRAVDESAIIAVINGVEIELRMYKSEDKLSVDTFYPTFKRLLVTKSADSAETNSAVEKAEASDTVVEGPLRIVSIVANPIGSDVGREKITLMNVFGGTETVGLEGWKVVSSNKSSITFGEVELVNGAARTFTISQRGSLSLSNKGGTLRLVGADGGVVQRVHYERDAARQQGAVLLWDGADQLVQYPSQM